MNLIWMLVLLAWGPEGGPTTDSGVRGYYTLEACHASSLAFSRTHDTPIQLCKEILEEKYKLLTQYKVVFDWRKGEMPVVEPEADPEVARLRKALAAIGRLHRGKTKDSQRVRAIIRGVE